jgi:hypothetical protein
MVHLYLQNHVSELNQDSPWPCATQEASWGGIEPSTQGQEENQTLQAEVLT